MLIQAVAVLYPTCVAPCAHTTIVEDGVEFKRLGKTKPAEVLDSDEESEDEKPAEEITQAKQDKLCTVV